MGELSLGRTKGGRGRLTEVVSYKKSKGRFTLNLQFTILLRGNNGYATFPSSQTNSV